MISGNILILGAIAILILFIGFGFLLGFLRGFRKSLFFTIVFIVVVLLSFIFATALAKGVYNGGTLWTIAKKVLPSKATDGADGVNSLKEFVRFYIEKNYTEVLENGMTAGQSIVANENAMGIIDGLLVMILKVVMLIGGYVFLSVIFYIVFGLIYILFLRPKTMIETETTTDEDGNETVEEREIKPKKKRLLGGLIGAGKGFIKSLIILIPITFMIGMIAQIEVPTNSTINSELKLESGSSSSTLKDLVTACRKYDNSIGKMYLGLDDFVMDRIISYDVKGADGKKVNVVVRKELNGFIEIYNTIEKEIGIDNIKDYDFKNNLNSPEMKKIVESVTKNISKSKAVTSLLTAVGEEASAIAKGEASKNDADMALLFEEIDLKNKDNKWWQEQIAQINDIYVAFADMNLDFSKIDSKEYNLLFKDTTSTQFDHFVDEIFNNELMEMMINGGVKYAAKKLPSDFAEVEETTTQVVNDKEVDKELKAFSKFIDILRDDIKFKDGSVDTTSINMQTLNNIVGTEILVNSKIVGKLTTSLLKNTINKITYNGDIISFDLSIFDDSNFVIHDEIKNLTNVLVDGFGLEYSLEDLKDFENTSQIGQISKILDSDKLKESKIANGLFKSIIPIVANVIAPSEDFSDVTWSEEYKSFAGILESLFDQSAKLSTLTELDFDTFTIRKIDNLANANKVWSGKAVSKILNGLVIPFIEDIQIDGSSTTISYDKSKIKWQNELKAIVEIGLWANDTDNDPSNDYDNNINTITNSFGDVIKVKVLDVLGENVQDDKENELLHAFANAALSQLFDGNTGDSKDECPALASVAYTLADSEGKFTLSSLNSLTQVYVSTIDALEANTYKSVVLMDKIAYTLSTPMSTPSMLDSSNRSAWTSDKWYREMPRIGEVLKTLANDDDAIIIDDANMGEDSEIKRKTFERLEENIAYSEALENMFKNAMSSVEDSDNPYIFPNPEVISGDETFSAWWNVEITGLANVIYSEYGTDKTTIKISEFSDTKGVKVKVVKSLYSDAYFVRDDVIEPRVKDYGGGFYQETNVGVSEYLQYMFKPQLRDVSKRTDPVIEYFEFTNTFDWDKEMEPIMALFLATQMEYNSTTHELVELTDETELEFGDIFFGLYESGSTVHEGGEAMDGLEASIRNKRRITGIKEKIDGISYLQYILATEMVKIMDKDHMVEGHKPYDWDNETWIKETTILDEIAQVLITEDRPKMDKIDFYTITDSEIDVICNNTPKSYLLQSKMAKSFVNAGINNEDVTSASSLTGEKDLMTYILEYEWNNETNVNEAYEALITTLREKKNAFKAMKNNYYQKVGDPATEFNFYKEEELINIIVSIGIDGSVVDEDDNDFLTEDVSNIINAIRTYSEYTLMVSALKDSENPEFTTLATILTSRANTMVYTG